MQELILAASSSRRHLLLNKLGLDYSIEVPNIDETPLHNELPDEYVVRMAQTKARAVSNRENHDSLLLAADTVISLKDEIIGKPENAEDAKRILHTLSGKEHEVITCIYCRAKEVEFNCLVKSSVKLKTLSSKEIDAYCLTQEPHDNFL